MSDELPILMCTVTLMEDGYFPAKCHRDRGHSGLHRAFTVGGFSPGYWNDGETETHTYPWHVNAYIEASLKNDPGRYLPSQIEMEQNLKDE